MDNTNGTCTIDGCDKPTKRRGWCYGHYMKWWRYGTTHPNHERGRHQLAGQTFGELTATEWVDGQWLCTCSCGNERRARSFDLLNGEAKTCGDKRKHWMDHIGYGSAHDRVRRLNGSASRHQCVDCGNSAAQWSYAHTDPDELISESSGPSHGLPYSPNPEHYQPRCVSCHKRFDLARA